MKKVIIFYSLNGNTKFIASNIAQVTGADLLELKPAKDISSTGFIKYFIGGRQAMMSKTPELLPFDADPQSYDMIFFGTPVWAGTYAPALNSFFKGYDIKSKKIALYCCHAGGKGKIFEKMKVRLQGNEIFGQIDFKDPLKGDKEKEAEKARSWASDIVTSIAASAV